MNRWISLAWVALFWIVGAPLFFGGAWLGVLIANGEPRPTRALWIIGMPLFGFAVMALAIYRLVNATQRSKANVFETQWLRGYYIEAGAAAGLYVAACIAQVVAPAPHDPMLRNLLILSPVPGVVLIVIALARWVLKGDEFWRQRALKEIGVAAAATAAWTWSYGFFEQIGFPKLSMFWVWPSMLLTWALWSVSTRLLRK
jgi:hypothetical protein